MLREVKDAGWTGRRTLIGRRYAFATGKHESDGGIGRKTFERWSAKQRQTAVPVMIEGERTFWWCLDEFWVESEGLDAGDVHALVFERRQRKRRKLEHAHATVAGTKAEKRAVIPREARQTVFERDAGRCVECGSNFELQFDHVIPVAMGGANTVENLQLLCAPCNKAKGATLG
jgi:hypothetical protein